MQQAGPATSWWKDRRTRTRVVIALFAVLALAGTLYPGLTNHLFAGDRRELVVTMAQDAGQPAREALRAACGGLPGVRLVADRGNPDPRVQGRFPVRFDIADITPSQYTALASCINRQPGVRGFLTERDGN